jgi:BioD-like phosphotransacetylase family protein
MFIKILKGSKGIFKINEVPMKRYFELSREERIVDSDKKVVANIISQMKPKKTKRRAHLGFISKHAVWKGWTWRMWKRKH